MIAESKAEPLAESPYAMVKKDRSMLTLIASARNQHFCDKAICDLALQPASIRKVQLWRPRAFINRKRRGSNDLLVRMPH